MKFAATEIGFTSDSIGEIVGVEGGTVRGWWRGLNVPSPEFLKRYAEGVGRTVEWLLYGNGAGVGGLSTNILNLIGWLDKVKAGAGPVAAYEALGGDVESLPPEERAAIEVSRDDLLTDLAARSGDDWSKLSAEQKAHIVLEIRRLAQSSQMSRRKKAR